MRTKKLKALCLALGWMGVIFLWSSFSVLPSPSEPWLNVLLKKGAHLIEYAILGILWYRYFWLGGKPKKSALLYALLISGIYAMTDEWHQTLVPGRHPAIRDVIIDWLGILAGMAWYINRLSRFDKKEDSE